MNEDTLAILITTTTFLVFICAIGGCVFCKRRRERKGTKRYGLRSDVEANKDEGVSDIEASRDEDLRDEAISAEDSRGEVKAISAEGLIFEDEEISDEGLISEVEAILDDGLRSEIEAISYAAQRREADYENTHEVSLDACVTLYQNVMSMKWQKLIQRKSGNDSSENVLFFHELWEDLDISTEKYCETTKNEKMTLTINNITADDCGSYRLHIEYKYDVIKHIEYTVKPAAKYGSSNRIQVVAIDIGATYSGYASQFLHDFESNKKKDILTSYWDSDIGMSKSFLKAPTSLLLDPVKENDFLNYLGYAAEEMYLKFIKKGRRHDCHYFPHFKAMLQNREAINDKTTVQDSDGHPFSLCTIFKHSIIYIKTHFDKVRAEHEIGPDYIQWVLTVPGTWKEPAKIVLQNAAREAGIPPSNLQLTLESNAALLYCNHFLSNTLIENQGVNKNLVPLDIGTYFVILDVGGTTSDITVYEITSRNSVRRNFDVFTEFIPEARSLMNSYINLLKSIFGDEVMAKFQADREDVLELERDLELKLKQNKNKKVGEKFPMPFPQILFESVKEQTGRNVVDIIAKSKLAGKFTIKTGQKVAIAGQEFEKLFEGLKDHIINHLKRVLEQQKLEERVSTVFMVGGMSEFSIIVNAMKEEFPSLLVLVPPNPADAVDDVVKKFQIEKEKDVLELQRDVDSKLGFRNIRECMETKINIPIPMYPNALTKELG